MPDDDDANSAAAAETLPAREAASMQAVLAAEPSGRQPERPPQSTAYATHKFH